VAAVRVALLGAAGRMGQAVLEASSSHPDIKVTAALVRSGSTHLGQETHGLRYSHDLAGALKGAAGPLAGTRQGEDAHGVQRAAGDEKAVVDLRVLVNL